jgi:hypothetical protein
VLLALAYVLLLAGTAFALELVARKSHKRAEGYRNAGFVYFQHLDYFECPAGRQLVKLNVDYQKRPITYHAPGGGLPFVFAEAELY